MKLSMDLLAPLTLSFALMAGAAQAENDNNLGFSCDMVDLAQEPNLQDRIDTITPANVIVSIAAPILNPMTDPASPPTIDSGFIVDRSGYIVTSSNNIDAQSDNEINVTLYDPQASDNEGEELTATLVGVDEMLGIAVLKIETDSRLTCANIADSAQVRVGDDAYIISSNMRLGYSLSRGIISSKNRSLTHGAQGNGGLYDYFQTDAAANVGTYGAALYNDVGLVVGMMSSSLQDKPNLGINFAVQGNDMRESVSEIIQFGAPQRGGMGVSVAYINEEIAAEMDVEQGVGVLINSVGPDQSADKAGIMEGDIILELDGEPLTDPGQMTRMIVRFNPGETISVKLMRNHIIKTLEMTFVDRNAALSALPKPEAEAETTPVEPTKPEEAPEVPAIPPEAAPPEEPALPEPAPAPEEPLVPDAPEAMPPEEAPEAMPEPEVPEAVPAPDDAETPEAEIPEAEESQPEEDAAPDASTEEEAQITPEAPTTEESSSVTPKTGPAPYIPDGPQPF